MIFILILLAICVIYLWWLDLKLVRFERMCDFYYTRYSNMTTELKIAIKYLEAKVNELEKKVDINEVQK